MSYQAHHERSIQDPDGFWGEQAKLIHWEKPFDKVLNYDNPPFAKWFEGGLTNLCYNAVDRHVKERPNQTALVAVSSAFSALPPQRVQAVRPSPSTAVMAPIGPPTSASARALALVATDNAA